MKPDVKDSLTTELTNDAIAAWLGVDLRAARLCEACETNFEKFFNVNRDVITKDCPDCDGGIEVLDEDRRDEAVGAVTKECEVWSIGHLSCNVYGQLVDIPYSNTDGNFRWIWNNRHGKPWREPLEQHVLAYRAEPPNYTGDAEILKAGLRGKVSDYRIGWEGCFGFDCTLSFMLHGQRTDHRGRGDTELAALLGAVAAAMEEQSEWEL